MSPVKLSRSRIIKNYLLSPSPKKRFKDTNCQFCQVETKNAEDLETHLNNSDLCLQSYYRNFKVKCLQTIILSQFDCLFCDVKKTKFSVHLKKSPRCQSKYFIRFKVNCIKDLMQILENFRRKLRNSRTKASRRLETERRKSKAESASVKTKAAILNDFLRETTFFNVKTCFMCKSNVVNAEEVSTEDLGDAREEEEVHLSRRFQTYWRCGNCKNGIKPDSTTKFQMRKLHEDDKTILAPVQLFMDQDQSSSAPLSTGGTAITCMYPTVLDALNVIDTAGVKPRSNDTAVMYRLNPDILKVVSLGYENEIFKYKRAKYFSDRYHGVLKDDGTSKCLASADKVANDHVIVGSNSYHKIEDNLIKHRFEQFGPVCYSFEVLLEYGDDVKANCLLLNGLVVTATYIGSPSSELVLVYYIHNHYSDKDCSDDCRKETLQSYLDKSDLTEENMKSKYIATYLTSVQTKMQSFVKNFLKESDCELYSEEFSLKLVFEKTGSVKIQGYCWPKQLQDLNVEIAKYPECEVDAEIKAKSIKFIDSTVSNSSNAQCLQSRFGFSTLESTSLVNLVKKYQYHHCEDSECDKCNNPRLPALETDFAVCPEPRFFSNIEPSRKFRKFVKIRLKSLTETELHTISTEEWLQYLFESVQILDDSASQLTLKFNDEEFSLKKDVRLAGLLSKYQTSFAFYHYCLTCVNVNLSFGVVLVTKCLADCYNEAFNVSVLKAFKAPMELTPVNGYVRSTQISTKQGQIFDHDSESFSEGLKMTHKEISLAEAFSLLDKNLLRTSNSTSSEYINAFVERKMFFKKVPSENERTFTVEGLKGFYERQSSNIDKFLDRVNGLKITLFEFVSNYDFVGNEESRQILKLLNKTNAEIKDSDLVSAFNCKTFLPEMILTNKEGVFKLRKIKKVLAYPKFEPEDFTRNAAYAKVIMFYPVTKDPTSDGEIQSLFSLYDDPPVLDSNSCKLTVVQRVER